jgi:hypothetical protein
MGLFTTYLAYKVGKRVGRSGAEPDEFFTGDPTCLHYDECANEGGCLNRACEFGEISDEGCC